ncbi:DHH family phosphoesterase [Mesomycoplasma ovipneumoniae]|uniref:DHH family phosphoesterase n=1 Tax=Mesomycoplasma ovipneumoniae TaxID=29562 RepID=UPI00083E749A|nr:bifunctional oligoribonuclease/PAP phosphatase NrnA [Mesomycoplasma ovipneumoniae]
MNSKPYLEIIKNIEKHDNIFVFHHIRPDGDCLGAQQGFAKAIKKNFPQKNVFLIGDNNKEFDFLTFHFDNMDSIASEFFQNSLAITVDTADINRIQELDFFLNSKFKTRVKIDHHPEKEEEIYDQTWIDPTFCAASEMIGFILKEEKWQIDEEIALFVYLGILTDSGRFAFPSTTARTFEIVAFLMKTNFNFSELSRLLSQRTENEVAFQAHVLGNYNKKGKVLWHYVSKSEQEKFNLSSSQVSAVNLLSNIGDALIWLFLIEYENQIRVRIRSNGPVINKIAVEYGGGGHPFAAGINLDNNDKINQNISEILEKLEKLAEGFTRNG